MMTNFSCNIWEGKIKNDSVTFGKLDVPKGNLVVTKGNINNNNLIVITKLK